MSVEKNKPANGTVGYLLRVASDQGYVFRVYDKDHNFVDYDILHYDMKIQIQDDDATFYSNEHGDYLDHSPETLGYKE